MESARRRRRCLSEARVVHWRGAKRAVALDLFRRGSYDGFLTEVDQVLVLQEGVDDKGVRQLRVQTLLARNVVGRVSNAKDTSDFCPAFLHALPHHAFASIDRRACRKRGSRNCPSPSTPTP